MINYLKKIHQGLALSEKEMAKSIEIIMDGKASEAQSGAFLMGLSMRGETTDEITGAAKVMRNKVLRIRSPKDSVDCCGTGGDGTGTYNISTTVALVSAACGVPIAKHGNRAASSQSGAADVLEALGVNLDLPPAALEAALKKYNFCFLMAARHHMAMKYVVPVRRQLGFRTIFNILGPLANPANTKRQLIGVFDKKWLVPLAQSLKKLGSERAWIVYGHDGLDEISLTGPTEVAMLDNGEIAQVVLEPVNFGLEKVKLEDLKGGNKEVNARALRDVLKGKDNAYRQIVLANAAAVLVVHGSEKDLKTAVKKAATAIDSGKALNTLESYIEFSNQNHES